MLSTDGDQQRRTDLRRMKRVATSLLVFAAVVFIIARWQEEDHHWVGYIRATAEAAMVGAIADWFAVTALFRHPLGLPIPHTAIIQKRKDQIGESLGEFVRDNFLTREVLTERLDDAHLGRRVGEWLSDPEHARAVGNQSAAIVRGVTEVLSDDSVQRGIEELIEHRVSAIPVAPFVGKAIDAGIDAGHHEVVLGSTLIGLRTFLLDNKDAFRRRLYEESPWWVPEQIDDRIFDKIYEAVGRFLSDIGSNSDHEIRREIDTRTREFSERLKTSPEMIERGEQLKAELLAHPEVRAWSTTLWARGKAGVIEAADDPTSELRIRLEGALVDAGAAIVADPELQAKIDDWVSGATGYVAEQFRGEVADLIATTVQRWDTEETAERLELQVGRDLQFIRINGTVVGGVAGLVIYSVSNLFF